MPNFEDDLLSFNNSNITKLMVIEYDGPTESEYQAIGKAQAELFANEIRDLYTRYQYSTVGDMERSGMLTAGEDILSALSKIELFKQSI